MGVDTVWTEYDVTAAAGAEMRTYQEGDRTFVLGVQVRTWLQSVDVDAKHYTSELRDQVCLPVLTGAALDVADIAFARIVGDTYVGTIRDGREMSVHQFDLLMNASAVREDTATGWIETATDVDIEIPAGSVVLTEDIEIS